MELIKKYNGYASYAIAVLSIVIGFIMYATTETGVATSTDIFLYASYLFIFLVILAILGGSGIALATNPQAMMRTLISTGIIIVVFLLFYFIADGTVTEEFKKIKGTFEVSSFAIKLTEGCFYVVYLLMFGILGALAWGGVKSIMDN
jgi:hypothetical protein